jgi:hypothetical protein
MTAVTLLGQSLLAAYLWKISMLIANATYCQSRFDEA